jgi:hypothetical protein
VLVLVTGAIGYVAGPSGPGTGALPSPMPSVTPTPSPTASPRGLTGAPPASCGDGLAAACIAAGTYAVGDAAWPAPVTLDVPTGWFTWDPATDLQAVLVEMGSDAPAGSGWGIAFSLVDSVSQDPCDAAAGTLRPGVTASAAGLVDAMRSWPGFEVSAPTPVEVDGHPGLLVQVTSSRTAADCPDQAIWTTPSGAAVDAYPMVGSAGQPRAGTFRVVEAGGSLVVIRTTEFGDASPHELDQGVQPDPSRHAVDLAELRAILASIRIGS